MTTMNSATIQAEARFFWRVCKPGADHVIEVLCKPANQGGKIHIGYYDDEDAFVRDIFEYNGRCHISTSVQPQFLNLSPNRATKDTRGGCAALGGHGQNLVFGRRLKNYNSPARVNMEVI